MSSDRRGSGSAGSSTPPAQQLVAQTKGGGHRLPRSFEVEERTVALEVVHVSAMVCAHVDHDLHERLHDLEDLFGGAAQNEAHGRDHVDEQGHHLALQRELATLEEGLSRDAWQEGRVGLDPRCLGGAEHLGQRNFFPRGSRRRDLARDGLEGIASLDPGLEPSAQHRDVSVAVLNQPVRDPRTRGLACSEAVGDQGTVSRGDRQQDRIAIESEGKCTGNPTVLTEARCTPHIQQERRGRRLE